MRKYTTQQARSGIKDTLPAIECWENQFNSYTIRNSIPEFTSVCPKTGLPDFGEIIVEYEPDTLCIELKSLKTYITAYRQLGIFYENAVNRICRDLVKACRPVWMKVTGNFNTRGGIKTSIFVEYKRKK
ncbi:MAG: NADPH-dependent 7-cyano-7-deazaguanine reductase QueF [Elusimicrobia bacterium]|nr:NADPH-dependent 7-cyano-7-deazaguanine reductase QueF [Elusimicrobiota bacterium]MBD3412602.1 NADPH-dependent 7-cyano-7-deazaguanine reductase QueF [Elusimicrobiota bacterium]